MFYGSFAYRTQTSSKNSKPFWRLYLGRGSVEHPPSNGEGFRDIHHSISTMLDPEFHIWFIMTLYYKMRQILLQNATVITNCNDFITKCDSYYKMWLLLQIATEQTLYWNRVLYVLNHDFCSLTHRNITKFVEALILDWLFWCIK